MSDQFAKTERNRIRRLPKRGHYDRATIYDIIDNALICHVAFAVDGEPVIIPTLHARRDDEVLLHGASSSRMLRHAANGHPLTLAIAHVDGIVLARSVFHHSINYRSVVLFGTARPVEDSAEKTAALHAFTEQLLPGRWDDARPPTETELKATGVVALRIDSASAKVRTGPPGDDAADYARSTWAGVLPIEQSFGPLQPDPLLADGIDVPPYLAEFVRP